MFTALSTHNGMSSHRPKHSADVLLSPLTSLSSLDGDESETATKNPLQGMDVEDVRLALVSYLCSGNQVFGGVTNTAPATSRHGKNQCPNEWNYIYTACTSHRQGRTGRSKMFGDSDTSTNGANLRI